jgi:hypothetical protein
MDSRINDGWPVGDHFGKRDNDFETDDANFGPRQFDPSTIRHVGLQVLHIERGLA